MNRRTRSGAVVAGLAGASLFMWMAGQASADITVEHLGTTLTQTVGGNTAGGYFHGPTGAFTTLSGTEQGLTPWVDPAGGQPAHPTDLIGSYTTTLTGMPIPGSNLSTPIGVGGADVYSLPNTWGYDIGATVQSWAEADFDFPGGDAAVAGADIHVKSSVTYSTRLTFPYPYHLRIDGLLPVMTDPLSGNAATTISSPTETAAASLTIDILDGGLTSYAFTDADGAFSIPDRWLTPGAQVTISFTANTEAGFIASTSRVDGGTDVETVFVKRYGYSAPFIAVTPEPITLGVVLLGLAAVAFRRRK